MNRLVISLFALSIVATSHGAESQYYPSEVSSWAFPHLVAMKEPSLFHRQPGAAREEYRFLWLRTFHRPIAIRIWSDGAGAKMRVIRLSGKGGYEPGQIESDTTSPVTAEDWKGFRDFIAKATFWQMPIKEPREELGNDGSQWILEGVLGERYHVVDRWTPSGGSFAECCRFLITLSKQQIPHNEFY
jgi:hypothetical protein